MKEYNLEGQICGVVTTTVYANSLEEAIDVRRWNRDIPILCLEPISLDFLDVCIKNNVTITIHDFNYFKKLLNNTLKDNLKFHLKIGFYLLCFL